MSAAANPYASFGGDVVAPAAPPANKPNVDPYAAFGGSSGAPSSMPSAPAQSKGLIPGYGTISATPKRSGLEIGLGIADEISHIPTDPFKVASDALTAASHQGLTQPGRKAHPFRAWLQDRAQNLQEVLTGGQSADKPMGTSHGVLDVAAILSGAVGAAEEAPTIEEAIRGQIGKFDLGEALNKIRGIGRKVIMDPVSNEPTLGPVSIAKRVLRDPKEIESAAYEAKADALMQRGYEQAKLDAAHEERLKAIEDARQKELAVQEKLREQEARAIQARGKQQEALDKKNASLKPFEGVTYTPSSKAGIPKVSEDVFGNLATRQAATETTSPESVQFVTKSGARPSESEMIMSNLARKYIWTQEDFLTAKQLLGKDAEMVPGEGVARYHARLQGLIRARRNAVGMEEAP